MLSFAIKVSSTIQKSPMEYLIGETYPPVTSVRAAAAKPVRNLLGQGLLLRSTTTGLQVLPAIGLTGKRLTVRFKE